MESDEPLFGAIERCFASKVNWDEAKGTNQRENQSFIETEEKRCFANEANGFNWAIEVGQVGPTKPKTCSLKGESELIYWDLKTLKQLPGQLKELKE